MSDAAVGDGATSDPVIGLEQFVRGEVDPRVFPHGEHVRMGFEMLRRHDFAAAAFHYSQALRAMTERIGKPQAFHQTVTIAFLALIAERMQAGGQSASQQLEFAAFAAANPDLMSKSILERWYSPQRLGSEAARATFLLPDRA
jgi:hypothetical protein